MPLQGKQQDNYNAWMKDHVQMGMTGCPNCKGLTFTKGELVKFPLANPYGKEHFSEVVLMQSCTNCTYVRFMDATAIGIVEP